MLRASIVVLALVTACKKDAAEVPKAAPAAVVPATTADGARKVPIEVNKEGYIPNKIAGKPGEKLDLVFTRTFEADCISQVKTPDGKHVELPMNKPVEVAVTVPAAGELGFACGMDMFHGAVVASGS
jgi:plastocyanin domain-containing protein